MTGNTVRWDDLSAEQRAFVRDKRLRGKRAAADWLRLLTPLVAFDGRGDRYRTAVFAAALLSLFGALGVGVSVIVSHNNFNEVSWLRYVTGVLLLAASVGLFVLRRRLKRLDLPPAFAGFVMPVLGMLAADSKPGTVLDLSLDLRGADQDDKVVSRGKHRARRTYDQTVYEDAWLDASARYRDGSRVRVLVVDRARVRRSSKKTRYKSRRVLQAAAAFSEAAFDVQEQPLGNAGTDPQAVRSSQVLVRHRSGRATVRGRLLDEWRTPDIGLQRVPEVRALVDLLAHAYRSATPRPAGDAHAPL